MGSSGRSYRILGSDRVFQAVREMVERDIRPGNTVTFASQVNLTQLEGFFGGPTDNATYAAVVVKAVALALREFPYANRRICRRFWRPLSRARLQQFERCDVVVATDPDRPDAVQERLARIVRDADKMPTEEILAAVRGVAVGSDAGSAQRVGRGNRGGFAGWLRGWARWIPRLWVSHVGGAVLVIPSANDRVDSVVATWAFPIGICLGSAKERPVARDGVVLPVRTLQLSMNFDRRIMAGAQAARLFDSIVQALETAAVIEHEDGRHAGRKPRRSGLVGAGSLKVAG